MRNQRHSQIRSDRFDLANLSYHQVKDTTAIPDFLKPLLISFFDDSAKKELQTLFNLEFY